MGSRTGEETRTYENVLRAVGAFLDRHAYGRFTLIELPEGFTLTAEQSDGEQSSELHFTWSDLSDQNSQLMRTRRFPGQKFGGQWHLAPTGRQDFLRALGFELDDAEAQSILIDELEDQLIVTYSHLDPSKGYQWRKRRTALGAQQMNEILQAAHGRRIKRGLLRR